MTKFDRVCKECGRAFKTTRRTGQFCSDGHRQDFNYRRQQRGSELYDLVMGHPTFAAGLLLSDDTPEPIRRVIAAYIDADARLRDGRPSHQAYMQAVAALPLHYGTEGDKR